MYPKKELGQHFLRSQVVIADIVDALSVHATDHFIEIGPGLGALTCSLLPLVNSLDVIEFDCDLIPELQKRCSGLGNLNIICDDVLNVDFSKLITNDRPLRDAVVGQKTQCFERDLLRIVGNLPYNISTPLIFHLLAHIDCVLDMHFMVQKEVAYRLAAELNTKAYGRLSIMTQYFCKTEILFNIGPEVFYPQPKVDSAVIRMLPKQPEVIAQDFSLFATIVREAFNHRRKTIANALRGIVALDVFAKASIDPKLRPEQLAVKDFVALANLIVEAHTA